MRITETRKAIIELIEPYMDKIEKIENYSDMYGELQLVEWVVKDGYAGFYKNDLISFVKESLQGKEKILNTNDFLNGTTSFLIYSVYFKYGEGLFGNSTPKIIKRIGYYDITAVFKYIENQIYLKEKYYQENCGKPKEHIEYIEQKFTINKKYIRFYDGYFPNKSLELYTDEEDKQLLVLLSKLKNYE